MAAVLDKQLRTNVSDGRLEWRFDESLIIFKFVKPESGLVI